MKSFVYWFPRIFNIALIVFLGLFSLDVFGMELSFGGKLIAFFFHLIPSAILSVLLAFSWKNALVGAIGFAVFAFCYIFFFNFGGTAFARLLFPLLFLLIAAFYAIDWKATKRKDLAVR